MPPLELLFQMKEQQSVLVIYFVTYAPLKCVHDMKTCVYNCDMSSTPRSAVRVRYLESFYWQLQANSIFGFSDSSQSNKENMRKYIGFIEYIL